jgi:drug/metabolite transporter (DMT)-like permease
MSSCPPVRNGTPATILGVLAVAFWSASVGLGRELAEALGAVTAPAAVYLIAGAVGCAILVVRGRLRAALRLPRRVLFGQGALFVTYLVSFSLAIGLSRGKAELVEIGLLNYLWPGLTLVLSVPLLGYRARWTLAPGIAVSLLGVLVVGGGGVWDGADLLRGMTARLAGNPLPYALCLLNVVAWSLYSNLARAQATVAGVGATPLYLLATGLALALALPAFPEQGHLTLRAAVILGVTAVFPALLSYWFWDLAMRQGRLILVASISYLIPLFSTIITSFLQELPMPPAAWLGCGLLVGGAWLCRRSVTLPPAADAAVSG